MVLVFRRLCNHVHGPSHYLIGTRSTSLFHSTFRDHFLLWIAFSIPTNRGQTQIRSSLPSKGTRNLVSDCSVPASLTFQGNIKFIPSPGGTHRNVYYFPQKSYVDMVIQSSPTLFLSSTPVTSMSPSSPKKSFLPSDPKFHALPQQKRRNTTSMKINLFSYSIMGRP